MFENLDLLSMAGALAAHAGTRQELIARNVANSDTPGYRAMETASFADSYAHPDLGMKATRPGHLGGGSGGHHPAVLDAGTEPAPNGNTVSLEREMTRSAEVRHQHDMALSIYSSSLDILRASLGRIR